MSGASASLPDANGSRARRGLESSRAALERLREVAPSLATQMDRVAADLIEGGSNGSPGEAAVAELLAVLSGVAARFIGLGGELPEFAQSWLDLLSDKANLLPVGLVVPATSEWTGMLSNVIRLPAEHDGIWSLPVAVHEYGHFIAAQLTGRHGGGGISHTVVEVEQKLVDAFEELPKLFRSGHELFADALAASVAGPAYTRYCLEYRASAEDADTDSPHHPSWTRRIQVQLTVLRRIAAERITPGFQNYSVAAIADLDRDWAAALSAAGVEPMPTPDPKLDEVVPRLIDVVLENPRVQRLAYVQHRSAHQLAASWPSPPDSGTSVATVLNAAWIVRRQRPEDSERLQEIETTAQDMIRSAVSRG